MALYEDLRVPDPEATTHTETENGYPKYAAQPGDTPTGEPGPADPDALAMPDPGTPVAAADMPRRPSMSNYIVLGGERTATGRPLLIGGPQMGYWSPEIVMEVVVSTDDFDARGIAVPGLGPILIAGRTGEYAWTPTSGGTDATDVRAEQLCEPDGGAPTRASRHYVFQGECRAMERPAGSPGHHRVAHGARAGPQLGHRRGQARRFRAPARRPHGDPGVGPRLLPDADGQDEDGGAVRRGIAGDHPVAEPRLRQRDRDRLFAHRALPGPRARHAQRPADLGHRGVGVARAARPEAPPVRDPPGEGVHAELEQHPGARVDR